MGTRIISCALLFISLPICIVLCKGNSTLSFVIDNAFTMKSDVDDLRKGLNDILDIVDKETSQIKDFVLVTFNDKDVVLKTKTQKSNELKKDFDSMQVSEFFVNDCRKLSMSGIQMGLENSEHNSHIYVITDGIAMDADNFADIRGLALQRQIRVSFILLNGNCFIPFDTQSYQIYYDMATATSGQVIHVMNIAEVLPVLQETVRNEKELLASRVISNPEVCTDVPFTVDDQTEYIIISVTGMDPCLSIIPDTKTEDIISIYNAKVVKLIKPALGDYIVSVSGSTQTSVLVLAKTDFLFEHGFSLLKPKSFKDTTKQPITCNGGHLSIMVTDPKQAVKIETVQILDMDENIIGEYVLKYTGMFYTTDFLDDLLCGLFKIAIKGTVIKTGQSIRRFSKTPLSPQDDTWMNVMAPITKISEGSLVEVEAGSSLILTCKIKAYPMPAISWMDSEGVLLQAETAVFQLPHEYISYLRFSDIKVSETYKCQADNIMGSSVATIKVNVKSPHTDVAPVIDKKTNVTEVKEDDTITINCKVLKGIPKPTITWFFKSLGSSTYRKLDITKEDLSISNANLDYSGHYKCKAENPVGSDEHITVLIVNKAPKVTIAEGTSISVQYGSSRTLTCDVQALPAPAVVWRDDIGSEVRDAEIIRNGFSQKSTITLNHVTISQKYDCIATNSQGNDRASIDVIVLSPFTVVQHPPEVTNVLYGDNVSLQCVITSHLPMKITWFYVNEATNVENELKTSYKYFISADGTKLEVKSVDLDSTGNYTCKATLLENKTENKMYTTKMIVDSEKPIIQKDTSFIEVKENQTVTILCKLLKGIPKPTIVWEFKGSDSKNYETISGSGESITLNNLKSTQSGFYKCKAENAVGKDEHITEVYSGAPPKIVLDDGKILYEAIEGDIVLRIPCNTTGYPKPTITWKSGDATITPGPKMSVEDGALIIYGPMEKDSNNYTCIAINKFGSDEQTFRGSITEFIENLGNSNYIYILNGTSENIPCRLPHTSSDSIRWFLEGNELSNKVPSYAINDATSSNDGNYTCRVSNKFGSKTETYVVDVGTPPRFKISYGNTTVDWHGNRNDILNCDVTSKPEASVEWMYNGVVISNYNEIPITDWGYYTCKVSNVHGTIQRTYNVTSLVCLIDRSKKNYNMPLLLNENSTTLDLETMNEFLVVQSLGKIQLWCPSQSSDDYNDMDQYQDHYPDNSTNEFKLFPGQNEIIATCDHKDNFLIAGNIYKLSDIECVSEILPVVKKTGIKCLNENTEKFAVGFQVKSFIKVYEVCYDTKNEAPIYTTYKMSHMNDMTTVPNYTWYTHSEIGAGTSDNVCNCVNDTLSNCYSKAQLVNVRDVSYGPPQASTFINHLNAIPLWHPRDSNILSWEYIEDRVRSQLRREQKLIVWSGTSKHETHSGGVIPRYLWKVVQFEDTSSIAMVYINGPSPSPKDVLCNNICTGNSIAWLGPLDNHTYCCLLKEFFLAFDLPETTFEGAFIDGSFA